MGARKFPVDERLTNSVREGPIKTGGACEPAWDAQHVRASSDQSPIKTGPHGRNVWCRGVWRSSGLGPA
jgi:hypothetical protein